MSSIQSLTSVIRFFFVISLLSVCLPSFGEECFEVYIPQPGVFFVEASVAAESTAEPRLDFIELQGSELTREKSFTYLNQLATSLVVEVHIPGDYVYCLGAQDPEKVLGQVKITSGFSASTSPSKGGDPDVDEEEPDTTPKLFTSPDDRARLRVAFSEICRMLEVDDHGDVLPCASTLAINSELGAELGNASGDDEDVFVLIVDELTTWLLESTGLLIRGILFDRTGQRLHVNSEATDTGWRIVKTLSPGVYFLKVSARYGEEGSYRLRALALDH